MRSLLPTPLMLATALFVLAVLPPLLDAQFAAENRKVLLKVNLGGGPVGDFLGEEQVLDTEDFAKNVARVDIQNTDQMQIFQSQRFARKDMTFRIPVPDGIYSVTLLFAETYEPACVPGGRVFDIALGTPVSGVSKIIDSFDVFQSAGCFSAHGKRFDKVPSKDGIVVHLAHKHQHPSLCGFIVEGFPLPKGDGSEFKAIAREAPDTPPVATPIAAAYSPTGTGLSSSSGGYGDASSGGSMSGMTASAGMPEAPASGGMMAAPSGSGPGVMGSAGIPGASSGYGAPSGYARAARRRRRRRRLLSHGYGDKEDDEKDVKVLKLPVDAADVAASITKQH